MQNNEKINKLYIKQKIDNLRLLKQNKRHFINLFNIIQEHNSKYTTNMNGIFFNLNELNDNVLLLLKEYLDSIDYNNNESETDTI
mgnify:CR=1 FL=1|jgi:hypothetical protein